MDEIAYYQLGIRIYLDKYNIINEDILRFDVYNILIDI